MGVQVKGLTIFMELRMSLTMAIDVFPCSRVTEGEFIWHSSQDGAIFEMELMNVEWPPSTEKPIDAINLKW